MGKNYRYHRYSLQSMNVPQSFLNPKNVRVDRSVPSITSHAFRHCTSLVRIKLGDGLATIDEGAFYNCSSLRTITLPSTVYWIGENAFAHCSSLTYVVLPAGLHSIHNQAFASCTSLKSIEIPPTVTSIDTLTFSGCTNLTNVTLHEGIRTIACKSFLNCTSLKQITIPSTVTSILPWAFANCDQLETINLNVGLSVIHRYAFLKCVSLRYIYIPASVTSIDDKAFQGCSRLSQIQYCDKIEDFIAQRDLSKWWKKGKSQLALRTYACFAEHRIPDRVSVLPLTRWCANIYSLISKIPNINNKGIYFAIVSPGASDIEITEYFLSFILLTIRQYEYLRCCAPFLEMAMWKHHLMLHPLWDRTSLHDPLFRQQCRLDSLSMVTLIMPLVFSFLELDSVNPKF